MSSYTWLHAAYIFELKRPNETFKRCGLAPGACNAMLWSWCTNASKVSQKRLVEVVKDNNDYWFCRFSFCVLPCLFQEITSNPAFVSDNFDIVQGRFGEYCLLLLCYNNLQSYDSKEFIYVTMLSKYLYKRDFKLLFHHFMPCALCFWNSTQ